MWHPLCNRISARYGLFGVGIADMILGITGILLVLLDLEDRHTMMNPREDKYESVKYDTQKESFQFVLEYTIPSLSMLVVGILVMATAATKRHTVALVTFILSTIQVAGFLAGVFALFISGADRMGILPIMAATGLQFYFHYITAFFTRFAWDSDFSEDTQNLVNEPAGVKA